MLGVIGVLVVLFGAAAVALRDEAVLVDAPPDRADLALPTEGPIGSGDLERLRFGMALRGYRMAQVDAVLDRVAAELAGRDQQLAAATSEVERLRARGAVDVPAEPVLDGETDPELAAAAAALAEPLPDVMPPHVSVSSGRPDPEPAASGPDEPPVEHVPGDGEPAEPLPDVTTQPGAEPPAAVPFPAPVRTDEPERAPRAPDDDEPSYATRG